MGAGQLVLLGGPAGAGKTTLAVAWCATSTLAVHIELDAIRSLIVSGLADPQDVGSSLQADQYDLSVEACCALARIFYDAGYDVVVDEVFEPSAFERLWRPLLDGLAYSLLIILPSLEETLRRAAARTKAVRPEIIRQQHEACQGWPGHLRLDTTLLTPEEALAVARQRLVPPT